MWVPRFRHLTPKSLNFKGTGNPSFKKIKNNCDNHFLFWTPDELVPILIIIAICGCLFPLKKSSLEGRVINKVCFISASGTEPESRCVVPPPTPLSYIQCTWYIFRQIYLLRYSFCSHQFVFPASKLSNMHLSALMGVEWGLLLNVGFLGGPGHIVLIAVGTAEL